MAANISARSTKDLIEVFDALVKAATREFGQRPLVCLEENEDACPDFRARLVCEIITGKPEIKKILGGFGTLTTTPTRAIATEIHEAEIPVVVELIRSYKQPDNNFDPELEYWEEVI